jgi:uracil-DNA glycosylase family 4
MRACTRCHLARTRLHVAPYRGSPSPRILFIGEAPGGQEDKKGLPFVGPAGRILDRALQELALPPEDYGITNVFMCRPEGNKFDERAADACAPWFDLKIARLKPRGIVTLGSHALERLLPAELPITRAAGRLTRWGETPVFPMVHPAATLRAPAYAERWKHDLATLKESLPILRGEVKAPA